MIAAMSSIMTDAAMSSIMNDSANQPVYGGSREPGPSAVGEDAHPGAGVMARPVSWRGGTVGIGIDVPARQHAY